MPRSDGVSDVSELLEWKYADLDQHIDSFVATHDFRSMDSLAFLRSRFDAGLAWIHFPVGLGGLGMPRSAQGFVDGRFAELGAPDNNPRANSIGLGMAAPTILAFGTAEQKSRLLRPLWTGEEVWCQLFSEPGAGSDLASVSTRAVRDGADWVVNGHKVWTSQAHNARWAILLARTNPDVPKHQGLTYFVCDMTVPGVTVSPLRQLTGEAEYNEVFLQDVRIPDTQRLGVEGGGWRVAGVTLNSERISIGAPVSRESGMIGAVTSTWRQNPGLRTPELHDRLLRLWVEAEVGRLLGVQLRQKLAAGHPGSEGSAMKLIFAKTAQELSGLELELLGETGLRYSDWTMVRPEKVEFTGRDAGYRYLRAKGNSIEGGTSEILKNIVAERVLGLPPEARLDKDVPWRDRLK